MDGVGTTGISTDGVSVGADRLKGYVDRLERLMDEIEGLKEDLKTLKAEAAAEGFNVPALTKLIALRRSKKRADQEAELLSDLMLYAQALGAPLDLVGARAPVAEAPLRPAPQPEPS